MQKNLVSCIITTYNRSRLLKRAIDSVITQDYSNFEIIIVDDCSTDNTEEVVKSYTSNIVRYIQHNNNQGLGAARNTGIKYSRGQLIAFLDDDDEWLSNKLNRQVQLLTKLPISTALVYCWMNYYERGQIIDKRHPQLRGDIFKYVLDHQPLGNGSTWLVRASALEVIGGFDEKLKRGIDGDLIRRLCKVYEVDFVPEVLVKYYTGHERITSSNQRGVVNAIESYLDRLTKFEKEFSQYPQQKYNVYIKLAQHYAQINEWGNSLIFYQKALTTYPFSRKPFLAIRQALRMKISQIVKAK